jgi:O-antigen/teichoic acid export membrane protein
VLNRPLDADESREIARRHIRGSSLLLGGRALSASVNFATQLLTVRYLSAGDFGALSYALVVVASCRTFATLGLTRAVTRFVPLYHERRDYERLFGTLLLVVACIGAGAGVLLTAVYGSVERLPVALLSILIVVVPLEAIDELLIALFASLGSPRAIFLRRHVLTPLFRLAVIVMLLVFRADVTFVAYGYVIATAAGVLISAGMSLRLLQRAALLREARLRTVILPARELFGYTVPLLTADALAAAMHLGCVYLLERFHGIDEVARFSVVLPAALLFEVVTATFGLIYAPAVSRLAARDDRRAIGGLYRETTQWMVVLSFPIFVLTFSIAQPLTVFLYGARYQTSGVILALLALGYYSGVAFGLNALTLKVLGKLRYVVGINAIMTAVSLAISLVLIPPYGALGAAIAMAATLVLLNVLNQLALRHAAGLSMWERRHRPLYLMLAAGALPVFVIQFFIADNMAVALTLAALVSMLVLLASRKTLAIGEMFPELLKLRLMRSIVAN